MKNFVLAILTLFAFVSVAEARHHHRHHHKSAPTVQQELFVNPPDVG